MTVYRGSTALLIPVVDTISGVIPPPKLVFPKFTVFPVTPRATLMEDTEKLSTKGPVSPFRARPTCFT